MSINFHCPKCSTSLTVCEENTDELYEHINQCIRLLNCTLCEDDTYENEDELIDHYMSTHSEEDAVPEISCPLCGESNLRDGQVFLKHLEMVHSVVVPSKVGDGLDDELKQKLPKVGDRIIAMWGKSKWQYFTACIKSFHQDAMKYEIDWDDGDSTGRIVDVENIAVDRTPDADELGVGTVVLFPQGAYQAGAAQQTGGKRWHQGVITVALKDANGMQTYNGKHTKTGDDGKFITYKGYSHEFFGLGKHDFRLAPNVFDVIHFEEDSDNHEDMDIYLSYDLVDSHKAVKSYEVDNSKVPETYWKAGYENMCDPADIEAFLREKGFRVARQTRTSEPDLKQVASMMKNAKVFIGCLSDQYVANNQCRMEFQYAKTSLRKPVIPLVVGDGSFSWMASVLGMLIAGELFIHFRAKDIEGDKNAEMLMNVRKHIPLIEEGAECSTQCPTQSTIKKEPAEVFLSYCWTNSQLAEDAKQIKSVNGSKLSDPRFLKDKLTAHGYNVWLDVEQLESANANAGLFGQIAQGLKAAKLVIPCISDEYSKSQNCRMEFQFALKSLFKPAIPIVVGYGEEWRSTVVGALLATYDRPPIDLQGIDDDELLEEKLAQIFESIESIIGKPSKRSIETSEHGCSNEESNDRPSDASVEETNGERNDEPSTHSRRAPKVGDHVVCHHVNFSYYMATVVEVETVAMTYTVDWDDGDSSRRVQPFHQVAVDIPPELDDIGVGSIIFFAQGMYAGNENNSGGMRYHEGEITAVNQLESGDVTVSGHHTKTEEDGKHITRSYEYYFQDVPLNEVRLAPTALEFML